MPKIVTNDRLPAFLIKLCTFNGSKTTFENLNKVNISQIKDISSI